MIGVMSERELVMITAPDCHLCAHARTVLNALGLAVRELDVSHPEAADIASRGVPLAFLPVLTDGERVLAYGRFSERRLRKDLGR